MITKEEHYKKAKRIVIECVCYRDLEFSGRERCKGYVCIAHSFGVWRICGPCLKDMFEYEL